MNIALKVLPVLLCIFLAGCSGDAESTDDGGDRKDGVGEPPLGEIKKISKKADLLLPLDVYTPSDKEVDDIVIAEQFLARNCMQRFGVEYPVIAQRSKTYSVVRHTRLFGLVSEEHAARYGYGSSQNPDDDPLAGSDFRKPTDLEDSVWLGEKDTVNGLAVPEGGCLAEGRRQLGGSSNPYWVANELQSEAGSQAESDSRMLALDAKWSSCMKELGYKYPNPSAAFSDPRWHSPNRKITGPSVSERKAAGADTSCKTKVNYLGVATAIRAAYENRLIDKNEERLAQHKAEMSTRLKNAAKILAENSSLTS